MDECKPLPTGTYRFKYIVDGEWTVSPGRGGLDPIHPLNTPYTPPIHPLYPLYTTIHPLYTPYTPPKPPLYTPYTPPIQPLHTPYTPPIYLNDPLGGLPDHRGRGRQRQQRGLRGRRVVALRVGPDPLHGRGLHSLTSMLNLRIFGTHRSR